MSTPSVAICTLFRDCAADVKRTFDDRSKWDYPREKLLHICVEGDSLDTTFADLETAKASARVIVEKHDSGRPKFGSVAEIERLQILAKLWNRALDIAQAENVDYAFITDSDISMGKTVLRQLINHERDVVAPMMFFEKSIFFRDTWAYRGTDGEGFTNRPPYHTHYKRPGLFQVNSVGLPLMKKEVVHAGARCNDHEVVGLCDKIRELGYLLFVDPLALTYHPRNGLEVPRAYEHK